MIACSEHYFSKSFTACKDTKIIWNPQGLLQKKIFFSERSDIGWWFCVNKFDVSQKGLSLLCHLRPQNGRELAAALKRGAKVPDPIAP